MQATARAHLVSFAHHLVLLTYITHSQVQISAHQLVGDVTLALDRRQPHPEVSRCETPGASHLINLACEVNLAVLSPCPSPTQCGLTWPELGNALGVSLPWPFWSMVRERMR